MLGLVTISLLPALGCSDVPLPMPDDFDAAFAHGEVCMPAQSQTGDGVYIKAVDNFDEPRKNAVEITGKVDMHDINTFPEDIEIDRDANVELPW